MNMLLVLLLLLNLDNINCMIQSNILLILLGCNDGNILSNRLESSFKFIDKIYDDNSNSIEFSNMNLFGISNPPIKITWFLSGGIKNNFKGAKTEASIMKSQIDNYVNLKNGITWNYVLDEKSTNTAQNFMRASLFLNTTNQSFDSIYVITSAFHYKRANAMLKLIDPSRKFNWIFGDFEEKDSRYWEIIHFRNVAHDVEKAKLELII